MPSDQLPSASNDYAATTGAALSLAFWNAVMSSIGTRLRGLEAQRADLQAVIDAGTTQALAMVAENIAPQLDAVGSIIASLNAQFALLEDNVANLLSGNITTDDVAETAGRVYISADQKTALVTLLTGVDGAYDTLGKIAAVLANAVAGPTVAVDGNIALFDGATGKLIKDSGRSLSAIVAIQRTARTSNTALANADNGKLIDITSGTFTQTFDTVSALGNGWFCYVRNSGSGDITLDPSGTQTIDGLTSFLMYPKECRLIVCDGTALYSVVLSAFVKKFTASDTFVTPPGYARFSGLAWGGGGGGYSSGGYYNGGGGGACKPFEFPASALGSSQTTTIGAGGAAATAGGNTSLGTLVTAYGGGGGAGGSGGGGGGGGFDSAASGSTSGTGATAAYAGGANSIYGGGFGGDSGVPGKSVYGGGGGGSNANNTGGTSILGGNGGAGGASATDGVTPGGGGGSSSTVAKLGARGELRIWGIV